MRRLALRAYSQYARYLVEVMRLPSQVSPRRSRAMVPEWTSTELERIWRECAAG